MKVSSARWQDLTLPDCLKYEELFQQWSSILDALRVSDQQARPNKGVSIQSMVFRWRVGTLTWKGKNAHAALKSHSQECATCRKRWEAIYEEELRLGESDSVTEWIGVEQRRASAGLSMQRGA